MSSYRVCHNCACAIAYADTSGMEGETLRKFNEFVIAAGPLADASRVDHTMNENFYCAAHFEAVHDTCGEVHIFEQIGDKK